MPVREIFPRVNIPKWTQRHKAKGITALSSRLQTSITM